jgi:DNA gyrase subunit A
MGKYHPGDSAIYDALARMAGRFHRCRFWTVRATFGSMDGDNPAAMRFTEVRMDQRPMLADIDQRHRRFQDNYDGKTIRTVLPSRFPNMLVNGAGGIAVGIATNIRRTTGEVIDACLGLIETLTDVRRPDRICSGS